MDSALIVGKTLSKK